MQIHWKIIFVLVTSLLTSSHSYTTRGNLILDVNGNPILLRGVNRPGFEWSPVGDSNPSLADYSNMRAWGANVIRLPLNQDFWLSGSSSYSPSYAQTIAQQVSWIKSLGMGVILDLHWSDRGNLQNAGAQQLMADANSNVFWAQVAAAYKNDPSVIFELYNEPHDVSWSVWLNGGDTGAGWNACGMQTMYNTVRSTGANNLVIICGLNWAYDLSGLPGYALNGVNIAYSTHVYDFPGKQAVNWPTSFGFLAATYPLISTEFGEYNCDPTFVTAFIAYAGQLQISWTSWAWFVGGCGFPSIITDWTGTPSVDGSVIKNSLTFDSKIPILNSTTSSRATTSATTSRLSGSSSGSITTTTSTTAGSSLLGIQLVLSSGVNAYWFSVTVNNGIEATSAIQLQDSGSYTTWNSLTYQVWGSFVFQPETALVPPISLRLVSNTGKVVTLLNVVGSFAAGSTISTNSQYANSGSSSTLGISSSSSSRSSTSSSVTSTTGSTPSPAVSPTTRVTTRPTPIVTMPAPTVTRTNTSSTTVPTGIPTLPSTIFITQYVTSGPWWFAVTATNDGGVTVAMSIKDSNSVTTWTPMLATNWNYFTFSPNSGSPLQAPISLRLTSATGVTVTMISILNKIHIGTS